MSCMLVCASAAPLKQDKPVKKVKPTPEAFMSIEDALKQLSKGTQAPNLPLPSKVHGISITDSKTEVEKIVNGVKSGHSESETKISKPSGKVIADVKTKSKLNPNGNKGSKINVPDEGVERQFGESPATNPLNYSPRAVAEYLMTTGDVAGIMSAFQQLVNSGKISSESATLDIESVLSEYSRLVAEVQEQEPAYPEPYYFEEPRDVFDESASEELYPEQEPSTAELAELYLMNQRLQQQEELEEADELASKLGRYDEPILDQYEENAIPLEDYERMNDDELRQSLSTLINQIYDDENGKESLQENSSEKVESNDEAPASIPSAESMVKVKVPKVEKVSKVQKTPKPSKINKDEQKLQNETTQKKKSGRKVIEEV